MLAKLIAHDDWLPEACAVPHPQYYRQYLLHCDPAERFSLVSFVWGPGQRTPVHDHMVWGLIGMLRGAEISTGFARRPDGSLTPSGRPVRLEPAEWLGGPGTDRHPLHLLSDQPVRRLHSQLDASGYSTAGKVRGREQLFIHPEDAASRGLADGDIVEVFNDRGRCQAAVCRSALVMRGVVRLNTGAWYDPDPATGVEKHGNPNVLTLDAGASGFSQGCSAQTCLVEVSGPIAEPPPVTAFDLPELLRRSR